MAMKQEDKYPTLEQSKRIAELLGDGAPESEMCWWQSFNKDKSDWYIGVSEWIKNNHTPFTNYPCYDVAELGEILSKIIPLGSLRNVPKLSYNKDKWYIKFDSSSFESPFIFDNIATEATARAMMIILILEDKAWKESYFYNNPMYFGKPEESDKEKQHNIEYNITKRWENGIFHHYKSVELFSRLAEIDFEHGGDYFCWKSGGDGDNGEMLMYELDIYFEELENY